MQYSQYCAWQQEVRTAWAGEQRPYWATRLAEAQPIEWLLEGGPRLKGCWRKFAGSWKGGH